MSGKTDMDRRDLLLYVGSVAITAYVSPIQADPAEAEALPSDNEVTVRDRWIDQAIDAMRKNPGKTKAPVGSLFLGRFADPMYFLTSGIGWDPPAIRDNKLPGVRVPRGFVTDLASIPRQFWSVFRPDGDYTYAAIIHDYLYWEQNQPKSVADEIFRQVMLEFQVARASVNLIYEAVSLGGGASWRRNAELKASGERRQLKQLPGDPRVRWAEWKRDAANFQ